MSRSLEIGSVVVPVLATADLTQTYTPQAARSFRRFASGAGTLRQSWSGKLATDISGSGPVPSGLLNLTVSAAMTIKCVKEYALPPQASNVFSGVTANRRSDAGATPYGRALVAGNWVVTPVTWGTGGTANTATLTTVSDATAYQLVYYPSFSAIVDPVEESWDWAAGDTSWSIHAEEV